VHPTLTIGPLPLVDASLTVSTYLLVRFAFLAAAPWLVARLNAGQGIATRDSLALCLIGIPAGLAGAHLTAILETGGYERFDAGPLDFWRGRSAILGGFLAGAATAGVYGAWRGLPVRRFLDACAPVMALGEGVTRLGCFLKGCCYGRVTESWLGLAFPRASVVFYAQAMRGLIASYDAEWSRPVHPTQLYAAAFGLALAAALLYVLRRRRGFEGRVFCLFLLAYGAWRLALFPLRGDPGPAGPLGLHASQLASLAAIGLAVALWLGWRRAAPARR
jgi:phosphatidylglycerol:prolipoprotein diacylglycerol transferase